MSDIVERLHDINCPGCVMDGNSIVGCSCLDAKHAAAEIKRLQERVEELEAFVCSIAWGPPHIIEPLHFVNTLVEKAQKLCPKSDEEEQPSNVVAFERG